MDKNLSELIIKSGICGASIFGPSKKKNCDFICICVCVRGNMAAWFRFHALVWGQFHSMAHSEILNFIYVNIFHL